MKRPWLLRLYRGWNTAQLSGDYSEIRIRSLHNQYFMENQFSFSFRGSKCFGHFREVVFSLFPLHSPNVFPKIPLPCWRFASQHLHSQKKVETCGNKLTFWAEIVGSQGQQKPKSIWGTKKTLGSWKAFTRWVPTNYEWGYNPWQKAL